MIEELPSVPTKYLKKLVNTDGKGVEKIYLLANKNIALNVKNLYNDGCWCRQKILIITEALMHGKNIKKIVIKQLKTNYPNWNSLSKKEKKKIVKQITEAVIAEYDFQQVIDETKENLLGIEGQVPVKGIITLEEMAKYIDRYNCCSIIKSSGYKRAVSNITDKELKFIDELLDNEIINGILAPDGYSPQMRDFFPNNFFRAELLKAIKYPEISYRKFCSKEYMGYERKQNSEFIGLPLNRSTMIDHTQLSQFRTGLSFVKQVNILVYILHHFKQSGRLGNCILHGVDSTELANDCKIPLSIKTINGIKIRIYNDIDCDCGARHNKRDKSLFVVGYRLHTLTAIDANTGHSFPLVSLLSPANHHDSHFLPLLVKLAQSIGIDVELITADAAYHDNDGSLYRDTGVIVTSHPSSKVKLPDNVDPETGAVFFDDDCSIPMEHVGCADQQHEYKCYAEAGECPRADSCPLYRNIAVDNGHFQHIPNATEHIDLAHDIRKNIERPFNLIKNQVGMEKVRVRSQHTTFVRCTMSSIAVLLLEMAGNRGKGKENNPQMKLPMAS